MIKGAVACSAAVLGFFFFKEKNPLFPESVLLLTVVAGGGCSCAGLFLGAVVNWREAGISVSTTDSPRSFAP
jgi:hypothetical protein